MTTDTDQMQQITNAGRRYFGMFPYFVYDKLSDAYEIALYIHYVRVCGTRGTCFEAERTTYTRLGMGREKFRKVRDALAKKGVIGIVTQGSPHVAGAKGSPNEIVIADLWFENELHFADLQRQRRAGVMPIPKPPAALGNGDGLPDGVNAFDESPSANGDLPNGVDASEESPYASEESPYASEESPYGTPQPPKLELELESKDIVAENGDDASDEEKRLELMRERQRFTKQMYERANAQTALKGNDNQPVEVGPPHPLARLIREKTGSYVTKQMEKVLSGPIELFHEDGTKTTIPGGLYYQWDKTPGFEAFAKERIDLMARLNFKPLTFVQHLRNLDKTDGKLTGFYDWAKKNPTIVSTDTKGKVEEQVPQTSSPDGIDDPAPLF